jgi:hypothetical protein
MGWKGLLLALGLLLLPSPSHASDENKKPLADADVEVPDLPVYDLMAWKHYSIRAKKLNNAGIAMVVIASALVVPGIVISALEAAPKEPGYDAQSSGLGILLIGTPSFCASAVGYAIGFGLLGKGWLEAARARKLASRELTAYDLGWAPERGMEPEDVYKLTAPGLGLEVAGLAILAGAWLAWGIDFASGIDYGNGSRAWLGMMPIAFAVHGVGAPLTLLPNSGMRKTMGLKGRTGVQVAGMVFWALSLGTLPFYWGFRIPYIGIAGSGFFLISAALSLTAGVRSLRMIEARSAEQPEASVTLMPFVSPVPGGVISGFAGTF